MIDTDLKIYRKRFTGVLYSAVLMCRFSAIFSLCVSIFPRSKVICVKTLQQHDS